MARIEAPRSFRVLIIALLALVTIAMPPLNALMHNPDVEQALASSLHEQAGIVDDHHGHSHDDDDQPQHQHSHNGKDHSHDFAGSVFVRPRSIMVAKTAVIPREPPPVLQSSKNRLERPPRLIG